jgi:hypothetical protein
MRMRFGWRVSGCEQAKLNDRHGVDAEMSAFSVCTLEPDRLLTAPKLPPAQGLSFAPAPLILKPWHETLGKLCLPQADLGDQTDPSNRRLTSPRVLGTEVMHKLRRGFFAGPDFPVISMV